MPSPYPYDEPPWDDYDRPWRQQSTFNHGNPPQPLVFPSPMNYDDTHATSRSSRISQAPDPSYHHASYPMSTPGFGQQEYNSYPPPASPPFLFPASNLAYGGHVGGQDPAWHPIRGQPPTHVGGAAAWFYQEQSNPLGGGYSYASAPAAPNGRYVEQATNAPSASDASHGAPSFAPNTGNTYPDGCSSEDEYSEDESEESHGHANSLGSRASEMFRRLRRQDNYPTRGRTSAPVARPHPQPPPPSNPRPPQGRPPPRRA